MRKSARPTTSTAMRASIRTWAAAAAGRGRLRRLRRGVRRHLRRHLRPAARRRRRGAAAAGLSRQRPALRDGDHAGGGRARQGHADPHAELGELRHLPRHAAPSRAPRQDLHHLPRPRAGAACARASSAIQQTCPQLPRHRQDHSRALRHLPRPGPHQEAEDAGSEDPGRHRRRHAHPLVRQRRAGHQRRPAGRPVHRDPHQAARRSSSATATTCIARCRFRSRTAALGGEIEVPTLQGKAAIDMPEGTQAGKTVPPARQGHQGRAFELSGRPVLPRRGRDAGQAHRAPAQAAQGAGRVAARRAATKHSPNRRAGRIA